MHYILKITALSLLISYSLTLQASKFSTDFQSEGNFESIYLDRHHVACYGQVLTSFRQAREVLNHMPTGKMYYQYNCSVAQIDGQARRYTAWNDEGLGNTIFLDRHNVACQANEALVDFRLVRQINAGVPSGNFRYEYGCAVVNSQRLENFETSFNDDGRGATAFLDRHEVACPAGSALNSFRLLRNTTSNQYKYAYTCVHLNAFSIDAMKIETSSNKLVANTSFSDLYAFPTKWVPRCSMIGDYPASKSFTPDLFTTITIAFPSNVVARNLPDDIQRLVHSNGISLDNVEVFFHAQTNSFIIGEDEDHTDGSMLTSRLKTHGFADPAVPSVFNGGRVNRNFLAGLFDVDDSRMEDELRVGVLQEFNVNTHDSVASPRNMRIRIPNRNSHSFWSLVIDHENSNAPKRAVATLHWLIGEETYNFFTLGEALLDRRNGDSHINEQGLRVSRVYYTPRTATFGDLYRFLTQDPKIRNQPIVRKLHNLLYR